MATQQQGKVDCLRLFEQFYTSLLIRCYREFQTKTISAPNGFVEALILRHFNVFNIEIDREHTFGCLIIFFLVVAA